MKAVFSAQPRKLNFLSSARKLPPDGAVPSLSLAATPGMGSLPHFIMHLLVTSSLSPIPSRPFCLTEAGLRELPSRHSWIGAIQNYCNNNNNQMIVLPKPLNLAMRHLNVLFMNFDHYSPSLTEIKSISQCVSGANFTNDEQETCWETCSINVIVLNFGQKLYSLLWGRLQITGYQSDKRTGFMGPIIYVNQASPRR